MIFNVARIKLSKAEKEVLSKGMKFCPTSQTNKASIFELAITDLYRKLLLQGYHAAKGNPNVEKVNCSYPNVVFQGKYKPKSTWMPQKSECHPIIHSYAEEVFNTLKELQHTKKRNSANLTVTQSKALNRLRRRKDIIIKPSDKGCGVCILTPQQYMDEAFRQLEVEQNYKKLDENIIPQIQRKIKRTVEKHVCTGAIPQKTANLLTVESPTPARFYMLPKVHKNMNQPPGRPIMAGNGTPTERISEYVDEHLKKHISKIPSYIKDTNHFLEICRSTQLPPNSRIVTFDVSSLYTNIPHDEGIMAVGEFMSKFTDVNTTKMLQDLTQLILESNVFEFDGQLYIQLHGTAMGSKFAPSFANLYMNWLEQTHLPNAPIKPLVWRRYIDDVFAIFQCTDEELAEFTKWLNNIHPTIKFTAESNPDGVPFLDTFVKIRDNKIITQPHTKPTDTKQYLLPSSCHPSHIIKSIPYSQALRIQRICSDESTLKKELENLKGFFINRMYPPDLVEKAIEKVLSSKPRSESQHEDKEKTTPTALVIPFYPNNPPFQRVINKIWVKFENKLNNLIGKPLVAFKRPKNLREILTKARFGQMAIPTERDPTSTLIKRPINTYDKQQMKAPVKFIMFTCEAHYQLHENLEDLEQAYNSQAYASFCVAHHNCSNINLLPVHATHQINIKCTECKFNESIVTHKPTKMINNEILNICDTRAKAIHRQPARHHGCTTTCKTCQFIWQTEYVDNPKGTKYRLIKFNCKARKAIYIIRCTKCQINYVGMTTQMVKQRISNHVSNIKNHKETSIAEHFNDSSHIMKEHFKIGILDCNINDINSLRVREGFWIYELQTVSRGINRREEANLKMDYQVITHAKHFQHSMTCVPYTTSFLKEVRTNSLDYCKRHLLNPKRSRSASALQGKTQDQSRAANTVLRFLTRHVRS
jgi:peptide-methionine (R)-S-oxide reductase